MLDEKSLRLLILNSMDRNWGSADSRIGIVIIQKRSVIEGLVGPLGNARARNLIWFWKSGSEFQSFPVGALADCLVQKAQERGLWAEAVRISEGFSRQLLSGERSFREGFVPGDAVLVGYPAEGCARSALKRTPEVLMWIK